MSEDPTAGSTLATPLHMDHVELGARFGMFGPAEIVHDYGVEVDEKLPLDHPLLADLSFQGAIRVFGEDATRFLRAMLACDISAFGHVGGSCYALMLTSEAQIIDLVYVARTGEDEYMLVVDAPVADECMEWLDNNSRIAVGGELAFPNVGVENQTGKLAVLCLMGPGAAGMLDALSTSDGLEDDLRCGIRFETGIANVPLMLLADSRVEGSILVFCPRVVASPLWRALLGFEELQVVGFDQYVKIRRAHGLWLDCVEDGKYQTPAEAGLTELVRRGGGFVGARAL